MRIAIIGRKGQIARELQRLMPDLGEVVVVGLPELDLRNLGPVRDTIRRLRPHVLVNAAAYTAVDRAEAEPDVAMAVNAEAPAAMAEEMRRIGSLFVHYSTDYVFDGNKPSPYTESDRTNPLNVYGASKLAGDQAVEAVGGAFLIFRTSWVYAAQGKNFLLTILMRATQPDDLRVVDDQIGTPTSSRDIADATVQIIRQSTADLGSPRGLSDRWGIYNMTAQGSVSWCGFAAAIVEEMRSRRMHQGSLARVVPITTNEFPTPAKRPRNSRLSNEKMRAAFGVTLPEWNESLAHVMQEIAILGTCPPRNGREEYGS